MVSQGCEMFKIMVKYGNIFLERGTKTSKNTKNDVISLNVNTLIKTGTSMFKYMSTRGKVWTE
jgi:hypothetical protein